MDNQTRQSLKPTYVTATPGGLSFTSAQSRRSVIVSASIILAVIVVLAGGALLYNMRSQTAQSAFGDAMQAYQTPVATPGQQVPPGMKTYSSVQERAKAAAALFNGVADNYGMTTAGRNARYMAGLTQMEGGENASAEASLKKAADSWNGDVSTLAKLALAQLYRQTGRTSEAAELYNQITAKSSDSVSAGEAQLQLAEMYDQKGDTAAARKIYASLKDKDAKSAAGSIASQKLNPAAAGPAAPPQM